MLEIQPLGLAPVIKSAGSQSAVTSATMLTALALIYGVGRWGSFFLQAQCLPI